MKTIIEIRKQKRQTILPATIILTRKSIQTLADGSQVGEYHSVQLDQTLMYPSMFSETD